MREGGGTKILGIAAGGAALLLSAMQLFDSPEGPEFEIIEMPSSLPASGPGPSSLRQRTPLRPLTEFERSMTGTWVAAAPPPVVNPNARIRGLAGAEAIKAGKNPSIPQPCLWLELYDNLTGFQHECAVINGEPSVFDQQVGGVGAKGAVGVAFTWRFDERLILEYDEAMSRPAGVGVKRLEARQVAFELVPNTQAIEARQTFPEYPDVLPQTFVFEAYPTYLGDPKSGPEAGVPGPVERAG